MSEAKGPKMWASVYADDDNLRFHGIEVQHRCLATRRNYYEVISYNQDVVILKGSSKFPMVKYGHAQLRLFGIKIVWLLPDGTELEVLE